MLLFIFFPLSQVLLFYIIQIHLMLLFIIMSFAMSILNYKFKYISCYYLSRKRIEPFKKTFIQIHLMLLFIKCRADRRIGRSLFKYISCYYLSRLIPTMETRMIYSNTSHVIIYRIPYYYG